jgi:hypothetical protein
MTINHHALGLGLANPVLIANRNRCFNKNREYYATNDMQACNELKELVDYLHAVFHIEYFYRNLAAS